MNPLLCFRNKATVTKSLARLSTAGNVFRTSVVLVPYFQCYACSCLRDYQNNIPPELRTHTHTATKQLLLYCHLSKRVDIKCALQCHAESVSCFTWLNYHDSYREVVPPVPISRTPDIVTLFSCHQICEAPVMHSHESVFKMRSCSFYWQKQTESRDFCLFILIYLVYVD